MNSLDMFPQPAIDRASELEKQPCTCAAHVLCWLGFHKPGEPVRYVVEDSFHLPDVAVRFCVWCGRRASWRFV